MIEYIEFWFAKFLVDVIFALAIAVTVFFVFACLEHKD
jgi:hypothetical protein